MSTAFTVNTEQAVNMIRTGIDTLAQIYGERGAAMILSDEFSSLEDGSAGNSAALVARALKFPAANTNDKTGSKKE